MPPRRAGRVSSSSRLFDNSSEAGGPLGNVHTNVGRGMSPGPAKYSSTYGSPPTVVPARQNVARQRYNLTSALNHVVDAVEQDNVNDARERAEREAELQRRTADGENSRQDRVAVARGDEENDKEQEEEGEGEAGAHERRDETLESVELVTTPGENEEPRPEPPKQDSRPQQSENPHRRLRSLIESRSAGNRQMARLLNNLTDEQIWRIVEQERIYAETRIFTPELPPRSASVVSKASHYLNKFLHSAGLISTTTYEDAIEEELRRAYPQLNFIRSGLEHRPPTETNEPSPSAANPPTTRRASKALAPANAMSSQHETAQVEPAAGQPSAASSSTTAARRGLRAVKSRVATPGAGVRVRRNILKNPTHDPTEDELAMNDKDLEAPVSSRSIFGRRAAAAASEQQARPAPAVQKKQQRKAQAPPRPADAGDWAPAPPQRRKGLWGYIKDVGQLTRLVAMAITLIVLGALAVRVFVVSTSPPELYSSYRMDNRLHWYGRDWRSNLRQFVPYVLIHPLGAISDEDFAKMNGLILAHANEVAQVKHMQRLNSDSLERINRILPAVVHMELDRRGRPVITQEFWHALKDSIQADRDIFTLIQRTDGSLAVSDLQWTALKHQLEASGMLPDPKAKALSVRDVETIAETTLSKSWEAWLRSNQNKVRDILGDVGPEPGTAPFSPLPDYGAVVEQLSDEQLATLARKMASSDQAREVIVSRKDFLQILQNSFVEHRVEIKGELADLEARVIELARTAASAVSSIRAVHPSGLSPPTGAGADNVVRESAMSRQEIMNLVDRLVRKGVSDAQLEAMARGKIKADWSRNLINQVNFFTINSGAAFNHHFSSPSYSPFKPFFWRRQQGGGGHGGAGGGNDDSGRGAADARLVPGSLRGSVAFEQWEQDGDCWCAATTGSNTGSTQRHGAKTDQNTADIAIKLGLRILPQYFVVEHINPSATLDPGAMPKDLEVWVQITEYNQRQLLQDWSSHHFPDTNMQNKLQGWGFVKIGAFTYESPTLNDGESQSPNSGGGGGAGGGGSGGEVQVFRLSPDLETLDIVTDHIVVRALTNYGDTDHTCFYRLRLYGKARPDVVE